MPRRLVAKGRAIDKLDLGLLDLALLLPRTLVLGARHLLGALFS